jgi:probable F420-dependent oxidoreductase
MKVRIGIGAGRGFLDPASLGALADDIIELGFDSIWLPEILTQASVDPVVALAWLGGRNPRLKLGTTSLLPGRNILRLAKQLATADALSGGRLLVTFVPGLTQSPEREAVGVEPKLRGRTIEDVFPVLRALWAGETVEYDGPAGRFPPTQLSPLPVQDPFEVWLGGSAHASLVRCGRFADGWLPSLCPPEDAAAGHQVITEAAEEAGRTISPEHFGVSVGYAREPLDDRTVAALAARSRGRDPRMIVPVGFEALRDLLERYIAVDFTKFVVRPMGAPTSWRAELEDLAKAVGDLQT